MGPRIEEDFLEDGVDDLVVGTVVGGEFRGGGVDSLELGCCKVANAMDVVTGGVTEGVDLGHELGE